MPRASKVTKRKPAGLRRRIDGKLAAAVATAVADAASPPSCPPNEPERDPMSPMHPIDPAVPISPIVPIVSVERLNNNHPALLAASGPECECEQEFKTEPEIKAETPEENGGRQVDIHWSDTDEQTEPSTDPFKGFSSSFKGLSSLDIELLPDASSQMSLDEAKHPAADVIPITSHILDTSSGQPAAGLRVTLFKKNPNGDGWLVLNKGTTNSDGRLPGLTTPGSISPGVHMMRFETGEYFSNKNQKTFYPHVEVVFEIENNEHYHVPLLLSPYGFSTYRGS